MTARRSGAVRAVGEMLDAAVHGTVRRFALVAPACIAADALGNCLSLVPAKGAASIVALLFAGMVFVNRARVIVIVTLSRPERRGIAWTAALRHPAALAFALVGMLDFAVPYLAVGVVAGPIVGIVRIAAVAKSSAGLALAYLAGVLLATAIAAAILIVLLLVVLAGVAATIDTVLDGTPPRRTFGRWLRQTFRRRSLGSTLVVAAVVALLAAGVPVLLSVLVPWGPAPARWGLHAVPEGIADALALLFAWRWRDAILVERQGRDIDALLDAGAHAVTSASPTASVPGVTTSQ